MEFLVFFYINTVTKATYLKGNALSLPPMNVVLGNLNTRSMSCSPIFTYKIQLKIGL